jgi:hypothetical protein
MPSYTTAQRAVELQREIPESKMVDAKTLQDIVIDVFISLHNG